MSSIFDRENIVSNDQLEEFKEKVGQLRCLKNEQYSPHLMHDLLKILGEYPSIKLLEDLLTHYRIVKHKLCVDELPALMSAAGMHKFELEDGSRITLTKELSIKRENEQALIQWLIDNGYQDSLKDTVTFNMGEFDQAAEQALDGYSYKKQSGVHYKTLEKIMKDRINESEALPPEDIAVVNVINIAKLK